MAPLSPVKEISGRGISSGRPLLLVGFPDDDKAVRIGPGEWPQENGSDHAENRAVTADRKGQRQDGGDRKHKSPAKSAQCITHVLGDRFQQWAHINPRLTPRTNRSVTPQRENTRRKMAALHFHKSVCTGVPS